jgi:hypothetical protein
MLIKSIKIILLFLLLGEVLIECDHFSIILEIEVNFQNEATKGNKDTAKKSGHGGNVPPSIRFR